MDGPPPVPGDFNVADGAGVVVSGTLAYSGTEQGQLRIYFLATEEGAPPRLLHIEKLDAVGPYSVSTPPNTGPIALVAFIDIDNDGPSPKDPAGMVRITIEESSMDAVDISLSDTPDLGDLTPGDAAPPEATDGAKGSASENPEIALPPGPETAAGAVDAPENADAPSADEPTEPPANSAPMTPTAPAEIGNSE